MEPDKTSEGDSDYPTQEPTPVSNYFITSNPVFPATEKDRLLDSPLILKGPDPRSDKQLRVREALRLDRDTSHFADQATLAYFLKERLLDCKLENKRLKLINDQLAEFYFGVQRRRGVENKEKARQLVLGLQSGLGGAMDQGGVEEVRVGLVAGNEASEAVLEGLRARIEVLELEKIGLVEKVEELNREVLGIGKEKLGLLEALHKASIKHKALVRFLGGRGRGGVSAAQNGSEAGGGGPEGGLGGSDVLFYSQIQPGAGFGDFHVEPLFEGNGRVGGGVGGDLDARTLLAVDETQESLFSPLVMDSSKKSSRASLAVSGGKNELKGGLEEQSVVNNELESVIIAQKSHIDELESDNKKMAKFLKQMKTKVKSLQQRLSESASESKKRSNELQEIYSEKTKKIFENEKLIEELKNEADTWHRRKMELESVEIAQKSKIEILEKGAKLAASELDLLKGENLRLVKEGSELREINSTLKNVKKELENQVEGQFREMGKSSLLERKNESQRDQLIQKESELLALKTELLRIEQICQNFEKVNNKLKTELSEARAEAERLKPFEDRCRELLSEVSLLRSDMISPKHVEILKTENTGLKRLITSKEDDMTHLRKQMEALEQQNARFKAEKLEVSKNLKIENSKKQELMKEIIDNERKIMQIQEASDQSEAILHDKNSNLEFEVKKLRNEILREKEAGDELRGYKIKYTKLLELFEAKKDRVRALLTEVDQKSKKCSELNNSLARADLELSRLPILQENDQRAKREALENAKIIFEQRESISALKTKIELLEADLQSLRQAEKTYQARIAQINQILLKKPVSERDPPLPETSPKKE